MLPLSMRAVAAVAVALALTACPADDPDPIVSPSPSPTLGDPALDGTGTLDASITGGLETELDGPVTCVTDGVIATELPGLLVSDVTFAGEEVETIHFVLDPANDYLELRVTYGNAQVIAQGTRTYDPATGTFSGEVASEGYDDELEASVSGLITC